MSCKSVSDKLGAYVDGELVGFEREQVEGHLDQCKVCCTLAEDLQKLDALAASQEVPTVTGEEWSRMFQGILERSEVAVEAPVPLRERVRTSARTIFDLWSLRRVRLATACLAAAVLIGFALRFAIFDGAPPASRDGVARIEGTEGKVEAGSPSGSEAKTEDYAEHLSGPKPEIHVDPDDGTTHLKYSEF